MSKNFSYRFDPINLPRRLREGLEEANDLLVKGSSEQALDLLGVLNKSFPHQPDILGLMANANLDMDNQHGYLHAIHELHELTPNRAEVNWDWLALICRMAIRHSRCKHSASF